ncbi:putative Zn-dependent protease with MMP-like domain [Rarobacter faecitabidus]|uniref:Putative Zn-dependent protease with MMP-like domain n=2 Tax=Rarobacter faecitabidus TaxID=13243 RepID=A0A542ZE26_RARFA|nr:putative Zn-dependent protease with MMP-like domain [Rarobacter faecitabidus]
MSDEDFKAIVAEVLDRIPEPIHRRLVNVAFVVESAPEEDFDLLGHYDGFPVTMAGDGGMIGALPNKITIYRDPILAMCESVDHVIEEVAVTVIHEIGHYFGLDDGKLHDLGWA